MYLLRWRQLKEFNMTDKIQRRMLFRKTGMIGAGLLVSKAAFSNECIGDTPRQPEGPFYPTPTQQNQHDTNTDLTLVNGNQQTAFGQVVYVSGVVMDEACRPIPGALVEIWQACATGRYNHPSDGNSAGLDPNFQYWARTTTDASGTYSFKTIKPGAYPNDPTWTRPSHIHYRVVAPGYPTLITQMYFEGDEYLAEDRILSSLTPDQQALVVVPFSENGDGSVTGQFNIVLSRSFNPLRTPELD
jgi:protocatechuate 3,4-dioxygenase beta subunit